MRPPAHARGGERILCSPLRTFEISPVKSQSHRPPQTRHAACKSLRPKYRATRSKRSRPHAWLHDAQRRLVHRTVIAADGGTSAPVNGREGLRCILHLSPAAAPLPGLVSTSCMYSATDNGPPRTCKVEEIRLQLAARNVGAVRCSGAGMALPARGRQSLGATRGTCPAAAQAARGPPAGAPHRAIAAPTSMRFFREPSRGVSGSLAPVGGRLASVPCCRWPRHHGCHCLADCRSAPVAARRSSR